MSNRDSLGFGDLLPQDVINIFAQDKYGKRGRKKRTRSLGRALGLFRRKKKKNLGTNGKNHGLGPALDLALDGHRTIYQGGQKSGNSQAQPNLNDDKAPAPPQIQENVFIEGSRSKYVEDLHTEAQEGLKMLQQEESNNGMEYQDNESMVSTATAQTDGESTGFVTDSTIADTSSVVSMRSSVSTRSSRHGLTRQGSTFRPLESGKKSEKTKTRRKHRKTVAGVPRHVQRELGLDREGWRLPPRLDEGPILDSESDFSPTADGLQHNAESTKKSSAGLQTSNIIHPLSKVSIEKLNAAHAGHRDSPALLHHLDPLEIKPRSIFAPWKSGSVVQRGPPSPVMTMSPQAAYMSKIIPNAVLPPSIDVVEINRSSRRSSLRTISKSSIISSPSPSRASSRASSNITSASRYNANPYMSDSSRWSNSASSETLVSNSSTISSSSTPKQKDNSAKANKVDVNSSSNSSKVIIKGDQVRTEGQFGRSLSVMKSKRVPLPPSRSLSLHGKKRRSKDLVEGSVPAREQSPSAPRKDNENIQPGSSVVPSGALDSPGYHADISSPDDSTGSFTLRPQLQTEEPKNDAERVLKEASCDKQESPQDKTLNKPNSPSSGYSSQDGTSPHSTKQPHGSSPKQKGLLGKIPLFFSSRSTSAGLAPTLAPQPGDNTHGVSPSVQTLRELFNIPPPPKIHAPPPPPPEVWSQNLRSIELLLGPPAPGSSYTVIKKNPKDRRQQRQSPPSSTATERKHKNPAAESVTGSVPVMVAKTESDCTYGKTNKERIAQNGTLKENGKDEKVRLNEMLNGILVKAVDKHGATRAEGQNVKATEIKTNTLPTISLARISPSSSSQLMGHQVQSTVRDTTVVTSSVGIASPESSWPPPPPPLSQGSVSRRDDVDFPLPPPPMFVERELVLSPKIKEQVVAGPQKFHSSQDVENPSLSIPPPPPYSAPPPPTTMKEAAPPPPPPVAPKEPTTSVIQEALPPVTVLSSLPEKQAPPPVEVSVLPSKDFIPPHHHQEASQPVGEVAPVRNFGPPQSIPPPPPLPPQLQPLKQENDPPHKSVLLDPETKGLSINVLIPPRGIPPPVAPLLQTSAITRSTDDLATDEVPPSPPFEFRNAPSLKEAEQPAPSPPMSVPLPPPLPVQVPASIKHQSSPLSTKNQEKTSAPEVPKEPIPMVTASLLQMVKLRSVNSSPEPSEVHEQVSASDVHEKPTSTVTLSLLQMVKLRSINNSPEHAKGVKEEAMSNGPSAVSQMVKLQSINNSPEPSETVKGVKEETLPNGPSSVLQTVKFQSINSSPETAKGVKGESLQMVKLQPANSRPEPSETVKGADEVVSTESPPILQTVGLQSINPETSTTGEKPEPDVTVDQQQPDKQVPVSSSNEAPQKPIRKSLILISPPPTTPPDTESSETTRPKSVVVSPAASPTAVSPVKKSPTTTSSVSMNLQQAIRLRTAARSKEGPASRLTLPSQLSPPGFLKSPTNTASFIFSKSNTRVGVEVKHRHENKETVQKKLENSSVAKVTSEAESKMGGKVPPPVAKKPKAKDKEEEAGEAVEQTAGQEAQQDGTEDGTEGVNGTAGTVQGETSS